MNTLRTLTNSDLLNATFQLASEERRISLSVLEHFREIERRKAYSDLGYRSLFEYSVEHLHYSEASASRRISAMYALKEHPELAEKIQSGQTTVSAVARIHTTIRRDEKLSATKWTNADKKSVYQKMDGLSQRDLEKELVILMPQAAVMDRHRPVSDELHELKVYLTSDDLTSLEDLMGWMGHTLKIPGSHSDTIRKLIQIGKENFLKSKSCRSASPTSGENVPAQVRREVFRRADMKCEYVDQNGNRCSSKHLIQIEHRKPRAQGGSNELSNLEVLCRDHNLIRGIQIFGADKMQRN